jgi:hypothetical protein
MAKKMSAANKSKVGAVMKAARKRKPTGRKVKFTPAEKSTLREVMQSHHGSRKTATKKKTAPARKKRATQKYHKAVSPNTRKRIRKAVTGRGNVVKRGRKAGFKHSAATRLKMSKSHKARHRSSGGAKKKKLTRLQRATRSKW